jgi:hypothetical protein
MSVGRVSSSSKDFLGPRSERGLFLLGQFSLSLDHCHGLLHIKQFEIAKAPQREIVFLGHLPKRLVVQAAVLTERPLNVRVW